MTENEAIEVLNNFDMQVSAKADGAYQSTIGKNACRVAVDALKEIQQYRAIGTVEECRKARDRQRGKKYKTIEPCKTITYYQCPCCNGFLYINENFCGEYGQAILWEGEDV